MSANTGIEWTDATWNPIAGCSLVSPGCRDCYAMGEAHRLGERLEQAKYKGLTKVVNGKPVWTGEVRLWEKALHDPLRWRKPRRIFVNSMSDLFHDGVSDEAIDRIFAVMALAPQHTFQVLTKRPERMRGYVSSQQVQDRIKAAMWTISGGRTEHFHGGWPLPNVWLGVSVEDQRRADERIPLLLDTPAAVRWVSAEPLLGPVDLRSYLTGAEEPNSAGEAIGWRPPLDWVVAGGEFGPDAQPMHPDWARSLRDQCAGAGVAFLFKQWGEHHPTAEYRDGKLFMARVGKKAAGRTLDGRTHDEYPQVRT